MLNAVAPVDGSRRCQLAPRHVIEEFTHNTAIKIHRLNIQPPFTGDIARFAGRNKLHDYQLDG